MHICVAGWYFDKDFVRQLASLNTPNVTFICHREGVVPFATVVIPNIGLEWGCYSYFLDSLWDGKSDVLFTHDDVKVFDPNVFKEISEIPYDFSMIFRDKREGFLNCGYHGRAFFAKERFLEFIKNTDCGIHKNGNGHKGIWYDRNNKGFNSIEDLSKNAWLNNGTAHMKAQIEWIGTLGTSLKIAPSYIQGYLYGFRGKTGLEGLYAELENQVFSTQPASKNCRI